MTSTQLPIVIDYISDDTDESFNSDFVSFWLFVFVYLFSVIENPDILICQLIKSSSTSTDLFHFKAKSETI